MTRTAAALLIVILVAPARAAPGDDGGRLYAEGMRLYEDRQYGEACPLLARSLAAAPAIRTRGALALCYERSGRLALAFQLWQAVLAEATRAGAAEKRRGAFASGRLAQLRPRLAMVTLLARDAPPDLRVLLDGRELSRDELGAPIALDVGAHDVEASAPGHRAFARRLELGPAETRDLTIGPLALVPREAPPVALAAPPRAEERPARRSPRVRWIGLATGGVGVAAVGVGLGFGISARSAWSEARSLGCVQDGTCPTSEGADRLDAARLRARVSTVSVIAGLGLVTAGTLLWALAPRERRAGRVSVGVAPAAGGFSLVLDGQL